MQFIASVRGRQVLGARQGAPRVPDLARLGRILPGGTTMTRRSRKSVGIPAFFGLALCVFMPARAQVQAQGTREVGSTAKLFDRDNLVAWCIVPFDARKRGPEE